MFKITANVFPYGIRLVDKIGISLIAIPFFPCVAIGIALGVLCVTPYLLGIALYSFAVRKSRQALVWAQTSGKSLAQRMTLRTALVLFFPIFVIMWVLALPFSSLDSYSRREHLDTARMSFASVKAYKDFWAALKSGEA